MTTTDLRTRTSQLVQALESGQSVSLMHRSRVIGEIKPAQEEKVFTRKDAEKLAELARELNLPKTTYAQRERIYRKHLMKKYGQGLSGR